MLLLNRLLCSLFIACSLTVVGCSSSRVSLVDTGAVNLDIVDTQPVTVKRADIVQDGATVIVSGVVERERQRAYNLAGHVDLTITSPNGTVLLEEPIRFQSRRLTRHMWEGRFSHRLDFVPPQDSTFRLAHHTGGH